MTPAQRLTFETRVPNPVITKKTAPLRLAAPTQIASLPIRMKRAPGPVARAMPDPQKTELDQKRIDALHAVYGTEIPGFSKPLIPKTPRPRAH
jgi:hypothetical protein